MYRLIIQAGPHPLRAEIQAGGPALLSSWVARDSYATDPLTAAQELQERVATITGRNPDMSAAAAQQRALELWLAELKADALDDEGLQS